MSLIVLPSNGPSGYTLTKSLRFRSSASAYLNRTPASAGNRQIFTWSAWVKRGKLGTTQTLLAAGVAGTAGDPLFVWQFSGDKLQADYYDGTNDFYVRTNASYRDPSAWYHLMLVVDSTQATSSNRYKYYVNGVQVTSMEVSNYPTQNLNFPINNTQVQSLCRAGDNTQFFDGYIAEQNFIDGQALTPSSFGSTNSLTGVWQPAKYTGTYGTNGFYLPFTNTTSTTTLGYDFSGNSNNWTTNNISLTAGSTYDSMTDVPTLTSATTANYAVFNPLQIITTGQVTVTNGNLTASNNSGGDSNIRGTIYVSSGQWYAEMTITTAGSNYPTVGIIQSTEQDLTYLGATAKSYCYTGGGSKGNSNSFSAYGASYTTGDVIGIAYDATNATLTFYKNGTSQGTAFTGVTAASYTFACSTLTGTINVNFGQRPFSYTPPTGFVALNTYNLPTSTIVKGNTVMDATIYTGDATSTRTITNTAGFKPDFVWLKNRTSVYDHTLYDSVRGAGNVNALYSDTSGAQGSGDELTYGYMSSFNSNGFGVTAGAAAGVQKYFLVNTSGSAYVGWQWQAGQGTNTTNTNGSITSTVSVNATAGFSVVTFTQTSGNQTVGHGLGVAPSMILQKRRNGTGGWLVYHSSLSSPNTSFLELNTTSAVQSASPFWGTVGSSTFGTSDNTCIASGTYVAYCWSEIAGFSKFGSYTGNGSADGPFIYTGFRPRFLLTKNSSSGSSYWRIWDTSRSPYNEVINTLFPNVSNAEDIGGSGPVDILSNGFKIRTSATNDNGNGNTIIYMAFAENPFKNALAR